MCAFLPLTNCTLPKFLTEAPPKEFFDNHGKYWSGSFAIYDSATEGAVRSTDESGRNSPQNDFHKKLQEMYWSKVRTIFYEEVNLASQCALEIYILAAILFP